MPHDAATGITRNSNVNRWPLFPITAGIALCWGLMVPTVFEWGQKGAARSRYPEMELAAAIVFLLATIVTLLVWWKNRTAKDEPVAASEPRRMQFSIRKLLIATALAAISLTAARFLHSDWAPWIVGCAIAVPAVWAFRVDRSVRWRMATLVAAMFLPFVWLILYNKPIGYSSGLIQSLPFGPAIFPAILFRGTAAELVGPAAILVALELLVGTWLSQFNSKANIAYLVFVLLLSCFNAFAMHALYRA